MKRFPIFIFITVMLISLLSPTIVHANDDIKGHLFEGEMRFLINNKIMGGYGDGVYLPNKNVSRAEFTAFLVRALGISQNGTPKKFTDVKKGAWYYGDVTVAASHNLIGGYGDGSIRPNNPISREEMAAMIVRALHSKGISSKQSQLTFSDESTINPLFLPSVKQLQFLGIIGGKGGNKFAPKDKATRGQTAAFLTRMLSQIANPKMVTGYTQYNYDFKEMINKQMNINARPQTDSAGSWYDASRGMVEFYANPNNFDKNSAEYFQFLLLSQSSNISNKNLNDKVLFDKGVLRGKAVKFNEASKRYGINEVYLVSHALLETGNGKSELANGVEVGLDAKNKITMVTKENRSSLKSNSIKKTYNMYGIGANDSCALKCGSERAYEEEWFTPDAAIVGGAQFIDNGYISAGQDTIYKMRWNPEKPATHQYATDVGWATKQTKQIQRMYELFDALATYTMVFDVPKYNNQPGKSTRPTGVAQFRVDTKLAGEKGKTTADSLNFRTGPTTNFSIIRALPKDTDVTIVGENSSWYKIKAGSTEGWVSKTYIQLAKDVKSSAYHMAVEEVVIEEGVQEDDEIETIDLEPEKIESENEYSLHDLEGIIGETIIDHVQFRSAPDLTENVLDELAIGTKVDILDEIDGWYNINVDGLEGWIVSESVVFINLLETVDIDLSLDVRSEPNDEGIIIGELNKNSLVTGVINENGELVIHDDWFQIQYDDQSAWIHQDYVEIR